jgi:hypothetical protein
MTTPSQWEGVVFFGISCEPFGCWGVYYSDWEKKWKKFGNFLKKLLKIKLRRL